MTVAKAKIDHAANLLGAGYTYAQAAELAGVSESSLYRRNRTDAGFRRQVEQARATHLRRATDRLGALTWKAIERLETLLEDESASVQIRAVAQVLQNARQYVEVVEIQESVRELQDLLADDLARAREVVTGA
jgi:hypothetical protein